MKTQILKIVSLLFVIAVLFPFNGHSYTGETVKRIKIPTNHPTGLTFDGQNLWLADRKTDKLYCIDPDSGKVLRTIESPGYWPTGLAWDGKTLWNADIKGRSDIYENFDGMIHNVDPKTGKILRTLRAPSPSPQGLAWDGKYLWCTDNRTDKIIQFSTEDGTTIHSFPSPASNPGGLTYDGKYLWVTDVKTDEIFMVDPSTGYVIIIADAPGKYTRGLTFDGKHLWAADFHTDQIYKMKVRDGVKYVRKDEQIQKVTYGHQVKNFGPGRVTSLDVHIALPEDRVNQEIIGNVKFSKKPTKIITDRWGQKTALFRYKNLEAGKTAYSELITTFKSWNVRYFLYPEKIGSLADIPEDIKKRYLGDNEKYQIDHSLIKDTVKKVVGDETNPYWIVRKLHQYLIGHLYYKMDGAWDTAPTVLRNGHGSCSEYSFVFISLCKAAGIPCRYVGATWTRTDGAYMDEVFHRWIEIYLPNYGWVPTDPTHGDRTSPRDQAFPIGLCRNKALITTQSGGGSKTMGWTYNSHEMYQTDPKTNINIEHFGDWEPVDNKK